MAMDLFLNTNYTKFVFEHAPLAIERILFLNTDLTNYTNIVFEHRLNGFLSFPIFLRISVWMSRTKPDSQIQSLPNSNELLRMLVRMFVLDYCDDKNLQPKA